MAPARREPAGRARGKADAGGLPACVVASADVRLSVRGEDGMPVSMLVTPVVAPVTVVSVDDCAAGSCAPTATSGIRIIVFGATGPRWTLDAQFPGLPADIVSVGEALESANGVHPVPLGFRDGLLLDGRAVPRRDSRHIRRSPRPGPRCLRHHGRRSANGRCFTGCFTISDAEVTYGTETRTVASFQTVSLGKLTFTHRYFRQPTGGCDPRRTNGRWPASRCADQSRPEGSMRHPKAPIPGMTYVRPAHAAATSRPRR